MDRRMSAVLVVSLLACAGLALQPLNSAADEWADGGCRVGLQLRDHTWTEYSNSGAQVVEESGSLYVVFAQMEQYFGNRLGLRLDVQGFGNSVDYDGQTQDGTPAQTDVDYVGGGLDIGPTCRLVGDRQKSLAAFAQVGSRIWSRDLQDMGEAIGYEEQWLAAAGRIGVKGTARVGADFGLFAEGGYRIPIYAAEDIEGEVTLEPEEQGSLFAELGLTWKRLFASVSYEKLEFDPSDTETAYIDGFLLDVYQPKSENELVSVGAGIRFGF